MTVEELIEQLEEFPPKATVELETRWGTTYPTQVNWDVMAGERRGSRIRCVISDYQSLDSLERQRLPQSQ